MLTVQQILRQRVRVEADYPKSPFKEGDILHKHHFGNGLFTYNKNSDLIIQPGDEFVYEAFDAEKYKNIFKPINWYEYRKLDDFNYVEFETKYHLVKGRVLGLHYVNSSNYFFRIEDCNFCCDPAYCKPIEKPYVWPKR